MTNAEVIPLQPFLHGPHTLDIQVVLHSQPFSGFCGPELIVTIGEHM